MTITTLRSRFLTIARGFIYLSFLSLPFVFIRIYKNILISDLFILLAVLMMLLDIKNSKDFLNSFVIKHDFIIPILIFSTGFLLSLKNAILIEDGITSYIQILFIFTISFPCLLFILNDKKTVQKALLLLTISTAIISISLIIFMMVAEGNKITFLILQRGWGQDRYSYGGLEPNITARILIQTIPLHIAFFIISKKKYLKVINLVLISINGLIALKTLSRSGLLTLLLVIILAIIFLKRLHYDISIPLITAFIFIIILLYNLIVSNEFLYYLGRYGKIFNIQSSSSSIQRLSLIQQGIEYIKSNPIIGLGLENSSFYTDEGVHIHNSILISWVENGLLGLVGFILIYITLLYYCINAYKHSFFNDKLLMGLTIITIAMIFGDMFMANSYKRILWIPSLIFINYYNICYHNK